MKHVAALRQNGRSLYMRIPAEWRHANNLAAGDLAFLTLVGDKPDEFRVKLVKLPVPQEEELVGGEP
jgi:hypothetical protein